MEKKFILIVLLAVLGGLGQVFMGCNDNAPVAPGGGQYHVGPPNPTETFTPSLTPTGTATLTPTATFFLILPMTPTPTSTP
jgi:hypothetical protein